jgi:hypothetical protein
LDKHKIKPVENERFKDAKGNPLKRYEMVITHVNNQKEQTWTVSKTVCLQIIEQLRKGFTVLKVTRHDEDRTTTYTIEGVQYPSSSLLYAGTLLQDIVLIYIRSGL